MKKTYTLVTNKKKIIELDKKWKSAVGVDNLKSFYYNESKFMLTYNGVMLAYRIYEKWRNGQTGLIVSNGDEDFFAYTAAQNKKGWDRELLKKSFFDSVNASDTGFVTIDEKEVQIYIVCRVDDKKLRTKFESFFKSVVAARQALDNDKLPDEIDLIEGAKVTIEVNKYERNYKARAQCLAHYGAVCTVCGFNAKDVYGDDFDGMIDVHHIHPLSLSDGARTVNPISDLIPVCSNCHKAIHFRNRTRSIKVIKDALNSKKR